MTTFHVEVELATAREPRDGQYFAIEDELDHYDAAVGASAVTPHGLGAGAATDATRWRDAQDEVLKALWSACERHGVTVTDVVLVRTIRWVEFEAELARPTYPDLVSGPEAGELLAVSKQRLYQLVNEHPDFPQPLYELGIGKLWTRQAVEGFARHWARKPGRPAKKVS